MKNTYLTAVLLFTLALTARAQEEKEIETDRPSETETTSTVPRGHFQMESGLEHEQEGEEASTFYIPSTLWKFGLFENLELRIITELAREKQHENAITGLKPVTVGFKLKLWDESGILPEGSLLPQVALHKIASKEFQEAYPAPEIRLLLKNKLSEKIELGYNIGAEWEGDSGRPTYQYTICPNFTLTEKLKTFIEAYGFLPRQEHPDHWVDGGFLFLLSRNVQLDIAAGYELTANNDYHGYFETVGISFRL